MSLIRQSPCKINLLLNILGRRSDGFHELETVLQPVPLCDELQFERGGRDIRLTCSNPELPTDTTNLVHRAAAVFLNRAKITDGVRIHLEKRIPMAAGLGGGSGNAAITLQGLNRLFDEPLRADEIGELAVSLGSDVPFFLQNSPALATGRGEQIVALDRFAALGGVHVLLIHPGFGISTAWAYQALAKYPDALNGRPGRAHEVIALLQRTDLNGAARAFYNSLEAPALEKYPLLALFREFLASEGAAALMSGSGSTTFALVSGQGAAEQLIEKFKGRFGESHWTAVVPL